MNEKTPRTIAVIPGAGSGSRMGGRRPKQFLDLCGRPVLAVTLQPFEDCGAVDAVVLVVPGADVRYCSRDIVEKYGFRKVEKIVSGGARRQDSVRNGLEGLGDGCGLVVIHDAARPLVTAVLLERVIEAARRHGSVITGLPARDTVKGVDSSGRVTATHDRDGIWLIQTPQAFPYGVLFTAHERALRENWSEAPDDASLVERLGLPVRVLEGSEDNIKVTAPRDLWLATRILETRARGEFDPSLHP